MLVREKHLPSCVGMLLICLDPGKAKYRQRVFAEAYVKVDVGICHDPVVPLKAINQQIDGAIQFSIRRCQCCGSPLVIGEVRIDVFFEIGTHPV